MSQLRQNFHRRSRIALPLALIGLCSCSNDESNSRRLDAAPSDASDSSVIDTAKPDANAQEVGMTMDSAGDSNPDVMAIATTVFSASLDETLPPTIATGDCVLTPSEGFAPLGPEGNKFGPTFLRCTTTNTFTLSLSDLPPHKSIDIAFLFAAIDSLDGAGAFPAGDYFSV